MSSPFKPIPFSLYTEWELPTVNRFQFEYDNVDGMRFIIIDSDLYEFSKRISDLLGKDGTAYIYGEMHDKKILYVGHLDKTYVRLSGWNEVYEEPWNILTPFIWLRDKILDLFKTKPLL